MEPIDRGTIQRASSSYIHTGDGKGRSASKVNAIEVAREHLKVEDADMELQREDHA